MSIVYFLQFVQICVLKKKGGNALRKMFTVSQKKCNIVLFNKNNSIKSYNGPVATKIRINATLLFPLKNYGSCPQRLSNTTATITKNRKFDKI